MLHARKRGLGGNREPGGIRIGLGNIGVAGEEVAGGAVLDHEAVGFIIAGIGLSPKVVVVSVERSHSVEHGGISPGAVDADDRDGVLHVALSGNVGEAFDPGGQSGLVELGSLLLGQLDGNGDLRGFARGDQGFAFLTESDEQLISVAGGDVAIFIHVGSARIVVGVEDAGHDVKDRLRVVLIGVAVKIDVAVGAEDFPGVSHVSVDRFGVVAHDVIIITFLQRLGEQVGGDGERSVFLGDVVHDEGEFILAVAGGVLAKLSLDLAVGSGDGGVFAHLNEGLGVDRVLHVRKTGALLQDGIVCAVSGEHGLGGGHEQRVDDLSLRQARGLDEIVLADVLRKRRHKTCHLRGSHGGTGHQLVRSFAAGVGDAVLSRVAVDGIDVAAGGGNFGLQGESARGAPGGEVRRIGAGAAGNSFQLIGDRNGTGVVGNAVFGLTGFGRGLDGKGGLKLDGGDGRVTDVIRGVHVDGAGGVVRDDDRNGAVGVRIVALDVEGDAAAVAEHDLAFKRNGFVDGSKIGFFADRVDVNVFIVARNAVEGRGGDGTVVRNDLNVALEGRGVSDDRGVLRRRNRQGVEIGGGRTGGRQGDGVGIDAVVILEGIVPGVGVTGGATVHGIAGLQLIHHGLIVVREGGAGVAGTEGQVDGVCAEDDGVLDRGHVVGIVGAAADAEDLHDEKLRVGRVTDGLHFFLRVDELAVLLDVTVRGRDTGDVGAVLALLVVVTGTDVVGSGAAVDVVVMEGDLAVKIQLLSGDVSVQLIQHVGDLVGVQEIVVFHRDASVRGVLRDGVVKRLGINGLVGIHQTGVHDRDTGARAVVTFRPHGFGAVGDDGVGHVGIRGVVDGKRLVAVFDLDLLDARNGFDLFDIAVTHVRGDHVHRQRQVMLDVQRCADRAFNLRRHVCLLSLQAVSVGNRACVLRNVLGREARVQRGFSGQHDGNADDLIGIVLRGFLDRLGNLTELLHAELGRIVGDERKRRTVLRAGCADGGDRHREQHRQRKKHGQELLGMISHEIHSFS